MSSAPSAATFKPLYLPLDSNYFKYYKAGGGGNCVNRFTMLVTIGAHRGIPNEMMRRDNRAVAINPQLLPEPDDAVIQFEANGGRLTVFNGFGTDPLEGRSDLINHREAIFKNRYPNFEPFFSRTVNGDNSIFTNGLLYLLRVSSQLASQL